MSPMIEMLAVSYMLFSLLVGLALHGFCIKFKWLTFLAHPIDSDSMFRGRRLFSANKTYRGAIAVGLGTALGFGIQALILHQMTSIHHLELIEYSPAVLFVHQYLKTG